MKAKTFGMYPLSTLYGKVRSMLNGARLTPNLCHGLWTECAACEKMEENILLSENIPVTSYKLLFGVDSPLSKNLCTFGDIGIIANVQKNIKAKLDNCGSSCIFVGYYTTHEVGVFCFYNTTTKHIHLRRNVTWLDRTTVPGKASGQTLLNWRKIILVTLVNL